MSLLKKCSAPQTAAAAIAGILLLIVICYPIGVANNGDFDRVTSSAALEYLTEGNDRYFYYVNECYRIGLGAVFTAAEAAAQVDTATQPALQESILGGLYVTTHMILVWLTVFVSALFSGIYSIRLLAAVYGVLFIYALFLGVGGITKLYGKAAGWIAAAAAVFMFCDLGYLAYFNSFYGEAAAYVFLMLAAGAFIAMLAQDKPRPQQLVLFSAAVVMFTGSKQQNIPLMILFLCFFARLFYLYKDRLWRTITVAFSCIMVLISVVTMLLVSREIYQINIHQAVFFGILRLSDDPKADLKELGLPEELSVLAGHTYYEDDVKYPPKSEYMQREFFGRISYGKIIKYYLTHPGRLWQAMEKTSKSAYEIMPGYLGSFTKEAGLPAGTTAKPFALYDRLRKWMFTSNPFPIYVTILFYVFSVGAGLTAYLRRRSQKTRTLIEFLAVIAAMGVMQFAIPYLADGDGDLNKHLFLFNVAVDILLFCEIVAAVSICRSRFSKRRATKKV